jgi:hypothetical protein
MHWSNFSREQLNEQERQEEMGDWHNHIKHLKESHRVAEMQLHELEKHPHVEESKVAELKKLKLKYKDEIQKLEAQHKDDV